MSTSDTPFDQDADEQDSKYASPDDFKIKRGGDGEVLPQDYETQVGMVKVLPMRYGDVEKYFGDSNVAEIGPDQLAKLFERHILRPDLSDDAGGQISVDYVEDMTPVAPREFLFAIMSVSGLDADIDMEEGNTAQVEVGN